MKNILIVCGHADYKNSYANKEIMGELKNLLPQAKQRILYDLYPDGKIDIEAEQKALLEADVIVFQYPFNWYDYPYLLKQYFDLVFLYNFAYGSKRKLTGKKLVLSFTIGGSAEDYTKEGDFHMTIPEFLKPQEASAELCGIELCKPVYSFDMTYLPEIMNSARKDDVLSKAAEHAKVLVAELKNLSD